MTQYKRHFVNGGCYFFTVNLHDRSTSLLTDNIKLLRKAFAGVKAKHPFTIDAAVIMPEHLHCILTLPPDDQNFSLRWRQIKADFSRQLACNEERSISRLSKNERGIWQRRFWEHWIRDQNDFNNHVNYIHYNPVKHHYCSHPSDWPYSSFHRFVKFGHYEQRWTMAEAFEGDFGE
ncbi:MAG: putative transposase [Phenylobacterium sp.]|jgi:putative transposase